MQEALKREELFFGEPSGVLDPQTRDGLKRFQARRGLSATGELDAATLRALEDSDEGRVVIRSLPPETATSEPTAGRDRDFLRLLEAGEMPRDAWRVPPVTVPPPPVPALSPPALPPPERPAIAAESALRPPPMESERAAEAPPPKRSGTYFPDDRGNRGPTTVVMRSWNARATAEPATPMPVRRALPVVPQRSRIIFYHPLRIAD